MHPPTASLRILAAAFSLTLVPGVANAHINLIDPPPRHAGTNNNNLKEGPCAGPAGDMRTTNPELITTYTAGETITITFDETFQHPGHYRVMLSSTGDAGFSDPTSFTDTEMGPGDLADGVEDNDSMTAHTIDVTLPNEACEECTIQLIQVMTDKPPFQSGTDDIYYQCADIVILPGEGGGTGGTTGAGGDTAAGGSDGGGFGSGGLLGGGGGTGIGGTVGTGGVIGAGGSGTGGVVTGAGGDPAGVGGGGDVPPPPAMSGCSLPAVPVSAGTSGWLGLAGLGWLLARRRRS